MVIRAKIKYEKGTILNPSLLANVSQELTSAAVQHSNLMRMYPPPTPSYQRTYKLRASWTHEAAKQQGTKLVATSFSRDAVATDARGRVYNYWVQSKKWQAWMHKGRWHTEVEVLDALWPPIRDQIIQQVVSALGATPTKTVH